MPTAGIRRGISSVVASESLNSLDYRFVITPVLLNVLLIFIIVLLFNAVFKWRRYPTFLSQTQKPLLIKTTISVVMRILLMH